MTRNVKFGVYLPSDLAEEIEDFMKRTNIRSKSKLIQEALRLFLAEHGWESGGKVAGIIGVIYNHHVKGVDSALIDVQHDYLDIIVSTLHIHITHELCMLGIVVRGDSSRIKELISKIMKLRGVVNVRQTLLIEEP
ncbi:MAG: CopG family ribbon-helix-helix protein [Desulfurococcales archaeon]|nr:CopG family ribbon-helix-helix protein [Desulfurococcales archaeon]